jgi:hypothetical protein
LRANRLTVREESMPIGSSKTADAIRAQSMMFERLESHVQGLAEAMTSMGERLEARVGEAESRMIARSVVVEEAVRELSARIGIGSLEARVAVVEKRLGIAK